MEEQIFQTKPRVDDVYVAKQIAKEIAIEKAKHNLLHVNKNCEISIDEQVVIVDTTISDVIINIPNDDTIIDHGKFYIFKDEMETAEINNVIINPNGLFVDKTNCFVINKNGGSIKIIYSKLKKKWYSLNV